MPSLWHSVRCLLGFLVLFNSICRSQANQLYLHPHEAYRKLQEAAIFSSANSNHDNSLFTALQQLEHGSFLSLAGSKKITDLSPLCANQTLLVLNSLPSVWALQMLDASAKPQRGVLTGITNWLGGFDECLGVVSTSVNDSALNFTGKYCTAQIPTINEYNGKPVPVLYQLGLCMPSGCDGNDTAAIANAFLQYLAPNSTGANGICQEQNIPFTTGAIVTLVVLSLMVFLCAVGTLYDMSLHMRSNKIDEDCTSNGSSKYPAENQDHSSLDVRVSEATPLLGSRCRKPAKQDVGSMCKLLLCFSVYTNGWKLLSTDHPVGSLPCLHGLRFISMSWVILGHTLVFSLNSIASLMTLLGWIKRFSFEAILNATVSVDSFFVLSGLLTAYLLLKDFQKRQTTTVQLFKSVPFLYLHRYIRLTPAYGFMLLFYTFLTFYLYNGPQWPTELVADLNCKNNSWANMLYINNIYDPEHECAAWSWYLANDFQFFLITPFVVYMMYRSPKMGVAFSVLLVLISSCAATAVTVIEKMGLGLVAGGPPGQAQDVVGGGYFTDYYVAPWCRYHSFGIGVIVGYIVWRCNGSLQLNRWLNLCLWLVSFALCFVVVYGPFDASNGDPVATVTESAFYNGWSRVSWSIGLGYVIVACCTGHGGWVNEFLSWRGFVPLSRMTYCAYLLHPIVMTVVTFGARNQTDYSVLVMAYMFAAYLVLSYAAAFVWSVFIEAPFLNLDKNYLTGALMKKVE